MATLEGDRHTDDEFDADYAEMLAEALGIPVPPPPLDGACTTVTCAKCGRMRAYKPSLERDPGCTGCAAQDAAAEQQKQKRLNGHAEALGRALNTLGW